MMLQTAISLALAAMLALAPDAQAPSPHGLFPWLQDVTASSVYVLVESSSPDTVTAEYGIEGFTGRAKTESIRMTTDSTYVHHVRISGLEPGTVYRYRIRQGADVSSEAAFVTAVRPGTPFRFAWMADVRMGVAIHDSIARRILDAHPAFSLYGGDLCRNSSYASWKAEFFRPPQLALSARVPFFNAPGNHEGWTLDTKAFTHAPVEPSGTEEFYSLDYGDMHVLVLNTQVPYDSASAQYAFARADLGRTKQQWKVVIAHRHAYCAGGHGEDGNLKRMTADIFEPAGVDMVISGHSHFYQRNLVNGIYHLIIGSAGAPLYTPEMRWYTWKSAKDYNYAIGNVGPDTFRLVVYNAGGEVLDSLALHKPAKVSGGG